LRALALQSAQFSRFRIDPAMPPDAWVRLYERWADNCLTGTMADAVLVARIDGNVAGMLTVGCRDGAGTIGLFAVDESARGRGFGTALLERGSAWFTGRGCNSVSVVTQGDNIAALRVYERAGYVIADVSDVYHLWLSPKE
jgi:ribosomal protein S18 acetylase RimI-like enzyme